MKILNQRGFSHIFAPLAVIVLFAIIGVGYLVMSHADSTTPLLKEDFSGPTANFTAQKGGIWSVAGGRYVLTNPAANLDNNNSNISVDNTALNADTYTLTASANAPSTASTFDDFSVIFSYQDASNYMYANFNESNNTTANGIFKVVNGAPTQIADFTATTPPGVDSTIRIEKSKQTVKVYRNDALFGSATDARVTAGKLGFGSYNNSASFDNLLVTTPSPVITNNTKVAWSVPANNATISGLLNEANKNCTAAASDPSGISKVDFYVDNTLLNSEVSVPYSCVWDTSKVPAGSTHTLKAVAYSKANTNVSSTITVKVGGGTSTPTPTPTPTPAPTPTPNGTTMTFVNPNVGLPGNLQFDRSHPEDFAITTDPLGVVKGKVYRVQSAKGHHATRQSGDAPGDKYPLGKNRTEALIGKEHNYRPQLGQTWSQSIKFMIPSNSWLSNTEFGNLHMTQTGSYESGQPTSLDQGLTLDTKGLRMGNNQLVSRSKLTRDKWHTISWVVKFQTSNTGFVEQWYDGVMVNKLNNVDTLHSPTVGDQYAKFGSYRNEESNSGTTVIYYAGWKAASNRALSESIN